MTPEELLRAIFEMRSPHCELCSRCAPDYPCDPDCHICWPVDKGQQ